MPHAESPRTPRIWIDADACPVAAKEILYKASARAGLDLVLVANSPMRIPQEAHISLQVVAKGADEADDHITGLVQAGDIVITADIPLADRVIKRQALVIEPRGELLTQANIGPRLALRDLMDSLRSEGMNTGGPAAYGPKEKQAFANQLDKVLVRLAKERNHGQNPL